MDQYRGVELPLTMSSAAPSNIPAILRRAARTRFRWTGVPNDPTGYILEEMLFMCRAIGLTEIDGDLWPVVAREQAGSVDPLGGWIKWTATMWYNGTAFRDREGPVLRQKETPLEMMDDECTVGSEAVIAMRSITEAMKQPVILALRNATDRYEAGDRLKAVHVGAQSILMMGESMLDDAHTLDLGVKDYTHSLIEQSDWAVSVGLALIGIKSAGSEKASGLTPEEVIAARERVRIIRDHDLSIRRTWAAAANAKYNLNIKVEWSGDDPRLDDGRASDPTGSGRGDDVAREFAAERRSE